MKKALVTLVALMMALSFVACAAAPATQEAAAATDAATTAPDASAATEAPAEAKPIKIAYTSGIKGDNGYNDEAWQGLLEAAEKYDFEYVSAECDNTDAVATESLIRGYAEDGIYDAIISVGTGISSPISAVAADYPEQKFIIIDSYVDDVPNVMSIGAIDAHQAFLSGVLSGILTLGGYQDIAPMTNDKGLISYCIGMDSPTQRAGAVGYMAGVKYVNPDCVINYTVIGSFSDPVTAKEVTSNNISLGADICTGNCGAGALGILEACKESGAYFISTSPSTTDPDYSICTSLKRVNVGVQLAVAATVENTFESGTHRYGLDTGYCEIGLDNIKIQYPAEILAALDAARQAVKDGTLVLPSDIPELDTWAASNHLDLAQFNVKVS
ncbi:MAG TPA: BMP family ABC transporter substrate-binding protein [Clostridia bacterium]|nr:BMP family ABC transporter substrate-binding protein [Clostridia bacterium]